jgi:hypothetical protein
MTETTSADDSEQLTAAASVLQSVKSRLEQSLAQRRQEILDRVGRPRPARDAGDLADCLDLVHTVSAYATVAQDLVDLGLLDAAQDAVSVGLAYADAGQECLDGLQQ